jgi:hypothetical protein
MEENRQGDGRRKATTRLWREREERGRVAEAASRGCREEANGSGGV